ncbi:uncharacterized protein K460DRAFT_64718 [Cucurbitaria berberidis CBS 394.84]|uniref:Uncharacterized protein n=1 Tax=Cucurbitaria berberidis CBS 394.84 TaxID=1168544 RepID=A0A9P4LAU1_9PLEO|nr:uncharacterized protein K460DRAFT_64718 [Cucurbitaria berberidis CBS 394.84]KAF1847853.1 hypothetical protein K460DRAFT_64718 [Cucurbitaria berberidis CBS 394.84]
MCTEYTYWAVAIQRCGEGTKCSIRAGCAFFRLRRRCHMSETYCLFFSFLFVISPGLLLSSCRLYDRSRIVRIRRPEAIRFSGIASVSKLDYASSSWENTSGLHHHLKLMVWQLQHQGAEEIAAP